MRPHFVVILKGSVQDSFQVAWPKYNDMIQALTTDRSDDAFFARALESLGRFADARACGFSSASSNEIPADASGQRYPAAQYARPSSSAARFGSIGPGTIGQNRSCVVWGNEFSGLLAADTVPDFSVPDRDGCE